MNKVSSSLYQIWLTFQSVLVRSATQFLDRCSVDQVLMSFSLTFTMRSLKLTVYVTDSFATFEYNTPVRDSRTSSSINVVWIFLFPTPLGVSYNRGMKGVDLPLEQWKLLGVFDAVSLQCLWLVVKETICSQGRNKVHDKVAYRSMAWVYNLCHILQHVVNGFDNVKEFHFGIIFLVKKFVLSMIIRIFPL